MNFISGALVRSSYHEGTEGVVMPIFSTLTLAFAQPPVWCPPPRPVVICPPIVWIECPPMPAKAPVKAGVPEIKNDEQKPKPEVKPEIKPVTNDIPMSPGTLPKLDVTPQAPKPAPKIEIELPSIPPAKDSIIPKPVDLPAIPPKLPSSISGYRPTNDVVNFPGSGDWTTVTLFNLAATEATVTVSGREVILPARTKQKIDVTGEVWWQNGTADRQTTERGGEVEIYLKGK